uniref:Uncharacterized protein n=1 Tax=Pyramimonas obovata TaxID=1411642 RepID=A0A7S0QTA1_9CHLO|mmetsp:Transcript_13740/g.29341  ORF Transcript_13740/g.29341 Transcript_13740/m.29341 type:complete len:147 (+) Transcript_13740:42-482(+)|eukprot:CAMPEP_0118958368 /NCGR_PEP_ID=MMETSP1169-20130426/62581_1 /TAXON_ID=36882 /ORGANISM="Pyramimonas obovata, Strain CCMP722" /LENGTH=146 /DNA_ID=CAMNT_0006906483 /DNA_START=656 /DNA_END=1096 /DNA_ORIENTATION=-
MASKAGGGLIGMLGKFIKGPYSITGPAAHPEYNVTASYKLFQNTQMPCADQYRLVHPGEADTSLKVPHADNDKVYNINYRDRDTRRFQSKVMGGVIKRGTRPAPKELQFEEPPTLGSRPKNLNAAVPGLGAVVHPWIEEINNGWTQ